MTSIPQPARLDRAEVVTKAVNRAAEFLELSQDDLAAILGTSPASVSRMINGKRAIDVTSKEYELARLFLRVYRSLDALVGGNDEKSRAWLKSDNRHLGDVPLSLLKTITGIVYVADYLDAMRGKV